MSKCSSTKLHKQIVNSIGGFECECCGTMMCENCPAHRAENPTRRDLILCEECGNMSKEERSKVVKIKRPPYVEPKRTKKEIESIKAIAEAIRNC